VSIRIDQKKITDFQTLHDAVPSAAYDIVQLERGTMTGTLTRLSGPVFRISTGSFSRGFRVRGVRSGSEWTLSVNAAPAMLQGFEMGPGDLFLLAPGQEIYASYPGANSYTVMLIEQAKLFAFLEIQQPGASDAAIWRRSCSVVTIGAARAEAFRKLVEAISNLDPAMLSADTIKDYRYKLLELVTVPILDNINQSPRLPLPASKLVREIDLLLSESGKRLVVSDLCERFRVPRRSLFNAFGDVLGVPPLALQSRMRLCGAYAVLSRAPDLRIKDVANAHGYRDQSKFAGDYHELFDENPRQTKQRAQRQRQNQSVPVTPP